MNTTWKESFKIRTYDADFDSKIKISSILNYMQETATNHADNLRIGYKDLLNQVLFWVLSRVKIHIIDFPKLEDEIKIET